MRLLLKSLVLMLCCAPIALATSTRTEELTNLTVITDPALVLPLQELVRDYSREENIAVTVVSSEEKDAGTLIGEGMEAHLLISADLELTADLQLRGLIDVFAQNPLVRTELAVVRRKGDANSLSGQWTLANIFFNEGNTLPIFILNPNNYIEGSRSIAALNANEAPIDSRETVGTKRELVERLKGQDSAGIMLVPDALIDPKLSIVSVLPDSNYDPIVFMALVTASEAMPQSRKLVKYLMSEDAAKIFAQYGFKPAE